MSEILEFFTRQSSRPSSLHDSSLGPAKKFSLCCIISLNCLYCVAFLLYLLRQTDLFVLLILWFGALGASALGQRGSMINSNLVSPMLERPTRNKRTGRLSHSVHWSTPSSYFVFLKIKFCLRFFEGDSMHCFPLFLAVPVAGKYLSASNTPRRHPPHPSLSPFFRSHPLPF